MFKEATDQNKKVIVIVGSSPISEDDFTDYVKASRAYYGDEYVFYYKGHPGYPYLQYPDQAKTRASIGLYDMEASIPAELIFFFNPEVMAIGYGSSTFSSLEDSQAEGIWNCELSSVNSEYNTKIDYAIRKLDAADETYGTLVKNPNTYLFEMNQDKDYNFDFAIFDAKSNTIKYYTNDNGTFTETQKTVTE